jgi:hypothetical protein
MPIPSIKILSKKKKEKFFFTSSLSEFRQHKLRQRRSLDLTNWQSADILFKQLYLNKNYQIEIDARMKRSEIRSELRPVEGPINIEQLPAMLAARNVKRYPYSQENDPAIM